MLTIRELIKTLYNAFIQKLKKHRGNWEQNDPAADDYIKNRPFYADGYTSIIKNETFTTHEDGEQCSPFSFKPIIGEVYKVTWNEKEYECIAFGIFGKVCIGNKSLVTDAKNTGEPFFYFYYEEDDYKDYKFIVKNAGTHTISIDKLNVKKIDKKFVDMPDTVSQDELAPVAISGNYWDLIDRPTIYTDVIRYGSTQSLTSTQKTQARTNIGAVGYESQSLTTNQKQYARTNIGAVGYESQSLTEAQQQQARTNIGAASTDEFTGVIRCNSTQSFTSTEKSQARKNIGAVGYESQSLTTAQKTQARANIGAASTSEFTTRLGRSTAVNAADTNYTTYMARGVSLNSVETDPTINGTIAWIYE